MYDAHGAHGTFKGVIVGCIGYQIYERVQKPVDLRGPGNRIYFIPGMSCEATRDTIHLSIECTI